MILTFFDLRINRDTFLSQIDIENRLVKMIIAFGIVVTHILSLHILHLQHFKSMYISLSAVLYSTNKKYAKKVYSSNQLSFCCYFPQNGLKSFLMHLGRVPGVSKNIHLTGRINTYTVKKYLSENKFIFIDEIYF